MSTRAVFLDRDGVINRAVVRSGKPYPPASLDELEIINGVPEALRDLHKAGFKLIVVTNQPDVGRGTTSLETVEAIHAHMKKTLALDEIRACYHSGHEGCHCRKPKPGMLLDAADAHGIDLSKSFMVGDRWRDVDAGHAAGCQAIFIDEGYDEQAPQNQPVFICASLNEAAQWIIDNSGELR